MIVEVPCGRCVVCRKNRASGWRVRLHHEFLSSTTAVFVTLTYDDSHLPTVVLPYQERVNYDGSVFRYYNPKDFRDGYIMSFDKVPCHCKRDIQLFLKVLRSRVDTKIRYFLVSEYCPTSLRPHYHAIIFGLPKDIVGKDRFDTTKLNDFIASCWKCGFTATYLPVILR